MADKLKRRLKLLISRREDAKNEISEALALGRSLAPDVRDDKYDLFAARYNDFPDVYKSFIECHGGIKSAYVDLDSDIPESENEVLAEFKNEYYECLAIARKLDVKAHTVPFNDSLNNSNFSAPKLAPIKLHQFNGNLDSFTQWYDLYVSLIHNNESLTDIHKYHYFLSSLSGQALALVKSIPFDTAHYQIAFNTLLTHYKNDRLLAMKYLDNIMNSKPVKSEDRNSLETFVNVFSENVSALQAMKIPKLDEFMLFYLATRLVDSNTLQQFELEHKKVKFPTAQLFIEFSQEYVNILKSSHMFDKSRPKNTHPKLVLHSDDSNKSVNNCICCAKGQHKLFLCNKFKGMSVNARIGFVKSKNLCFICLKGNHLSRDCEVDRLCKCKMRHNTLLCYNNKFSSSITKDEDSDERVGDNGNCSNQRDDQSLQVSCSSGNSNSKVLLGTVVVYVKNKFGNLVKARCLIDSGSMASFCTKYFYKKLCLPKKVSENNCVGIGATQLNTFNETRNICIVPVQDLNTSLHSSVIITSKISSLLPPCQVPHNVKQLFNNLNLSDKLFDKPDCVDILLGANLYPQIISDGSIIRKGNLVAFPTIFGYCVTGQVPSKASSALPIQCNFSINDNSSLSDAVNKFWELESVPSYSYRDPEEDLAESQFRTLYYRSSDGSYNSPILVKPNIDELGNSFNTAKTRLLKLEKSLNKNPTLRIEYNKFMSGYRDLGHMRKAELGSGKYYLPHHGVLKEDSTTTKLRVVYDGSAATSNGVSLNSCLYAGPKLNNDICDVMLRFRLNKVALVADICKMYRMVKIIPEHCVYQHILFRFSDKHPIEEWELLTNTQGLTSASYIAHRAIKQLNEDEGDNFPLAKSVVPRDLVVDNLCSGADDIALAKELVHEIINFFASGNFQMRKWISNEPTVLSDLPEEFREILLNFDKSESGVKLLGAHWNSNNDSLSFHISSDLCKISDFVTKRIVLSTTAKLFDPLGLAAPVVFLMKNFFQTLWKLKYDWDDPIASQYIGYWNKCIGSLHLLSKMKVPRFVGFQNKSLCEFQLLGFCDASELGYAATVYIRVGRLEEAAKVSLLMSKSRLAPLKKLTIPRLELLGAHLLKKLLMYVYDSLAVVRKEIPLLAWTDSSIVLSWLNTPLHKLKTFVCHRVADILQAPVAIEFNHINTLENPADAACRGLMPDELLEHKLWFNSPYWCSEPQSLWTKGNFSCVPESELPEIKAEPLMSACVVNDEIEDSVVHLINKMSSFMKLKKIVAYVQRFIFNCKQKLKEMRRTGILTADEHRESLIVCVKAVQREHFGSDLKCLLNKRECHKFIQPLCPFLDLDGVMRVGGRLNQSSLPSDSKNPLILPKKCNLTNLIIDHFHVTYLHVGPSTLVSILRRRFWILSARSIVRQRIHKCVPCIKHRAATLQPLMGQLPEPRVVPSRAFSHVGVDFAGPFSSKEHKRRGAKIGKCYLVVFVCLAVKAVHLEVVTEMSSAAFLAVFDRFCARRGLPSDVYSDCGTNFKGAAKYLSEIYEVLSKGSDSISTFMASKEIKWHFNSPSAPAMGGLWEAAVKSAKAHLRKSIGEKNLTYEEMNTLFHRIEAVLNSRPLTISSTDPHEVNVLTPGHFIIGCPLVCPPEPCLLDENEGLLKRWQLIRQMTQSFWAKWSRDYLNTLQERSKWYHEVPNLSPGAVVFLKGENTLPSSWPMARIEAVYPGPDSVVRVVDIRVGDKVFRRPVNKLVPLPTCV